MASTEDAALEDKPTGTFYFKGQRFITNSKYKVVIEVGEIPKLLYKWPAFSS